MRITTETGSVYDIDKYGMCIKTDKNGKRIEMFKALVIIPVPDGVKLVKEIYTLPQGEPIIGQRLYLSGLDTWWFTTPVVSIEECQKRYNSNNAGNSPG
jgi:hypothetical protein